jgi:hypothetical protein
MFIKILTPNHNGKIELTVRDLEALIQEAVDKAVAEDRANRPIQFWYGNSEKINDINTTPNLDWTKVTCSGDKNATLLNQSKTGKMTFINAVNDMIGE